MSSCNGDSGGPPVVQTPDGPAQIGVVSFGIACGQTGHPSVFGRTPQYIEWITSYVPNARVWTTEPHHTTSTSAPDTSRDRRADQRPDPRERARRHRTHGHDGLRGHTTLHSLQLDVPERSLVRIYTEGPMDTLGWLHYGDDQLLESDDGGAGSNFYLEFVADAGLYDMDRMCFRSQGGACAPTS